MVTLIGNKNSWLYLCSPANQRCRIKRLTPSWLKCRLGSPRLLATLIAVGTLLGRLTFAGWAIRHGGRTTSARRAWILGNRVRIAAAATTAAAFAYIAGRIINRIALASKQSCPLATARNIDGTERIAGKYQQHAQDVQDS